MIRFPRRRQLRFGAALAALLALVALAASSSSAPYRTGIVRAAPDWQVPPGATPATSAVPVFRPATHLADLAERLTQITPVSADVTVQVPGPPQDIATEVRERLAAAGWTAAPSEAPAGTAPSVPTMLFCRTPTASPHASVGINVSVSGAPGFSAVRLVIPAVRPDGSAPIGPCELPSGAQIPWTVTAHTPLLEDSREGVITR